LSHYHEESKMYKAYKTWDNNLFDDDECGEMPPPSTAMVSMTRTPAT
jgi:hypothetical protein